MFTDGTLDNPTLAEFTPEAQDLVAGFISETDDALHFTWQVIDIPDDTGGIPEAVHFYWEFYLDPDGLGPKAPSPFSLRARAPTPGGQRGTGGSLQGNCTTTGNVVQCQPVPGAVVTVNVDDAADTITAHVRRSDLKASDGSALAVDGAILNEAVLFRGIASYVGAGVISSGMGDEADLDIDYELGKPRV